MSASSRWLIISFHAGVDGLACSHHLDARIPYLVQRGVQPILVNSWQAARIREYAQSRTACPSPSGVRLAVRSCLRRRIRHAAVAKALRSTALLPIMPFYLLEKAVYDVDAAWWWRVPAAAAATSLSRRYQPQIIYSTGGPYSAHAAAAACARRTGLPWIAEMQDPLVSPYWPKSRREKKIVLAVERQVCHRADAAVFLTDAARRAAEARTGISNAWRVIYPGAVPMSVAAAPAANDRFTVAHFGSLSGTRTLVNTLRAVGDLLSRRPEIRRALSLRHCGTIDTASAREVSRFACPDALQIQSKVPQEECARLMRSSDVLLLIQHTDELSAQTIPSKVYEYLLSGRRILGLTHDNRELDGMLRSEGHVVTAADDPAGIASAIEEMYDLWAAGHLLPQPPSGKWSVERAVDQLVELANEIIRQRGDRPPTV